MICTDYTPGLLAELAKKPHVRSMEIPTTLFDVGDAELMSMVVDCDADSSQFGFTLGREVAKVVVSASPKGLSVSFVIDQLPEEGLDKISIVLSSAASVELRSEISAVSVIEETHTGVDTITSFFEDEASYEPWLVIVEPD